MDSDALLLARIQFGFTISFHIIFPAITIGLASYLAVLEGCWLRTRNTVYRDLYHFWTKIFAVNFGMGVVSGLVMAYQFGTNWSFFSDFAGSVTGPLLAYEVLTAFFLEAGFLGVMLFGWSRVGPGLHFFSTIMVALGTLISAPCAFKRSSTPLARSRSRRSMMATVVPAWLRARFRDATDCAVSFSSRPVRLGPRSLPRLWKPPVPCDPMPCSLSVWSMPPSRWRCW